MTPCASTSLYGDIPILTLQSHPSPPPTSGNSTIIISSEAQTLDQRRFSGPEPLAQANNNDEAASPPCALLSFRTVPISDPLLHERDLSHVQVQLDTDGDNSRAILVASALSPIPPRLPEYRFSILGATVLTRIYGSWPYPIKEVYAATKHCAL
jgi:hypothetical protein